MNWTKEPPDKEGHYLWRGNDEWENTNFECYWVFKQAGTHLCIVHGGRPLPVEERGGEWMILITGNVHAEEIEKAFYNGWTAYSNGVASKNIKAAFELSRAYRIAQGLE